MSMTTTGGNALMPTTMEGAMKLAEAMSRGKLLPTHLQGSIGDCLMVVEQAMRWGMSPFAVAQCTSLVKGKLMFEGKLVAAALHTSGALATRLSYEYSGEGAARVVRVSATLAGETAPRFVDVRWADAKTENAFWKSQPDQQLAYHGARVWARRYAPEVMLGVYAPEEMDAPPTPYAGATVDGVAEPVAVVPDRQHGQEGYGHVTQDPEPPRRTVKQFLDALEADLRAAETWEAVQAIEARDDVRKAQEALTNGAHERLTDMLDAARERTMHAAQEPTP
jgi:hypothetical protein